VCGPGLLDPGRSWASSGLVCCSIDGMDPARAVALLHDRKVIASTTPYVPSLLRFGASIVTTPEQVDHAVEAVKGLV